ncbi:hypothetical protein COV18_04515 [Candidatus Woesearchaeota archaeon CG10_big_fil_rev_8_21_14_0_10_37_12]|nr:MAG: hypothetical protein COV18_04515 [Candidatus Woesearchaeota archaeon CG10_big_fil_rev_8_21_14_0_10_37_12]
MHRHDINQTILLIAATIFAIVTFVHALRIAYGWPLVIGTWQAPALLSWIAIIITGTLAVLLWKQAHKDHWM